jgi:hypothetical protein
MTRLAVLPWVLRQARQEVPLAPGVTSRRFLDGATDSTAPPLSRALKRALMQSMRACAPKGNVRRALAPLLG